MPHTVYRMPDIACRTPRAAYLFKNKLNPRSKILKTLNF
jgi:hypothetical protein